MNDTHSINVATLGQPPLLIQAAVVDVLRQILLTRGVVEAHDDEPAERTVMVVAFKDSRWITVYDDGSIEDVNALCVDLSNRLGSPVAFLLVHDNNVLNLSLLRRGEQLDELRHELFEEESEEIAPRWEHWKPMLDAPIDEIRAELSRQQTSSMALDRFAKHLKLGMALVVDAEDATEEEFPGLVRIRLTSSKPAKKRRIVRPSIPKATVPVESKLIPELFIGKPVDVKRQWSKVLKKLFATRSWEEALACAANV